MKIKGGYAVRESECKKRDCFVPFEGNGMKICRLYELGNCPEKYRKQQLIKNPRKFTENDIDDLDGSNVC